ncbi:MAG: competence/damage-inducible protein A [Gemmatimonadota bacterium]|nr:competence/damage-inducible protein A [Gemmatimonadota bacterium]
MSKGAASAAVVSVGNELLFGETLDTNAAWLGRKLATLGISVVRGYTVGDVAEDIGWAVRDAIQVADLVLVTGGLGPTPDDLTKVAVANVLGRDLVVDDRVRESLQARYREQGMDDVPPAAYDQAYVPADSESLQNAEGTAPGIFLSCDEATIVLLPGVPRELEDIVSGSLLPHLERLQRDSSDRVWHHVIHTTGVAESRLTALVEERLADVPDAERLGVGLAYLPDLCGVDLRFTASGLSRDEAFARMAPLVQSIEGVVKPYRFESDSGDLAEAVSQILRERGMTIATAESCTGGLIAKKVTGVEGASDVFAGGIVAYSNEAKIALLGVSAIDLAEHGAVSETVATQLALGVSDLLNSDVGIGVTGVAGPSGGTEDKPVGTVWIATSLGDEVAATICRYSGGRDAVRAKAGQAALAAVYRRLVDATA